MGIANVGYAFDSAGKLEKRPWINKAISWIKSYDGPNLMSHPEIEAEKAMVNLGEDLIATAQGQGFILNQAQRKAIEN